MFRESGSSVWVGIPIQGCEILAASDLTLSKKYAGLVMSDSLTSEGGAGTWSKPSHSSHVHTFMSH